MTKNPELRVIVLQALAEHLKNKNQIFVDLGDELLEVLITKHAYTQADPNKFKARLGKTTVYGFDFRNENTRKEHNKAVEAVKLSGNNVEVLVAQGVIKNYGWYITETT